MHRAVAVKLPDYFEGSPPGATTIVAHLTPVILGRLGFDSEKPAIVGTGDGKAIVGIGAVNAGLIPIQIRCPTDVQIAAATELTASTDVSSGGYP